MNFLNADQGFITKMDNNPEDIPSPKGRWPLIIITFAILVAMAYCSVQSPVVD